MNILALKRIARNVENLERSIEFYVKILGFNISMAVADDDILAKQLSTRYAKTVRLKLGGQEIELSETQPASHRYPVLYPANAGYFQHFAMMTNDLSGSYRRLLAFGVTPISIGGPQKLPDRSGGVTAFKFRDIDGHPLELLQSPTGLSSVGIDHSAIAISDVNRSVAFYNALGLVSSSPQLNYGDEQAKLDGLIEPIVDVLSLAPPRAKPHVELLHYRQPKYASQPHWLTNDIVADRLVFQTNSQGSKLIRDPDGHIIMLEGADA